MFFFTFVSLQLLAENSVCYYYKAHQNPELDRFGTSEGGWVYGKNLQGHFEDGFFVVHETSEQVKTSCLNSIHREKGSEYKLLKITVGNRLGESSLAYSDSQARIIIFGDSLSDDGNVQRATAGLYPKWPYFMGRFSNGPIWTDYLFMTTNMGILNWAYGGGVAANRESTANPVKIVEHWITGNLTQYVDKYIRSTKQNQLIAPDEDIFIIWLGANDFANAHNPRKVVESVEQSILKLSKVGAKKFLVIDQFDFLQSPHEWIESSLKLDYDYDIKAYKKAFDYGNGVKSYIKLSAGSWEEEKINYRKNQVFENNPVVRYLNSISEGLKTLGEKTRLNVAYLDLFLAHNKIIGNEYPSLSSNHAVFFDYELQNKKNRCFAGDYDTGSKNPKSDTCSELKRSFFYDSSHPTTYAHCWISLFIDEALFNAGYNHKKPSIQNYDKMCKQQ